MQFNPIRLCWAITLLICCRATAKKKQSTSSSVVDWAKYELGELGTPPDVPFRSTNVFAPLVHITAYHPECNDGSLTFLSPRGGKSMGNVALALDNGGNLVWAMEEKGPVKSLQIQRYKGNNYITYWVGDDDFYGHGQGYYKMLDETYTLNHAIRGGNSVHGDYHEFTITKDDTALITSYVKTPWDLTAFGRESGYIWDCVFQEVDIETNEVLYEWKASDHFAFVDMAVNSWQEWTGREEDPWDWFHLNSVSKDDQGNYLVAARYTAAVTYLDRKSGAPVWHLGGKHNSFTDLSSENATKFIDVHMVHWNADRTGLLFFENISPWSREVGAGEYPRAGLIHLDQKQRTAELAVEYLHPERFPAWQEGSIQELESGNLFIGYGSSSVFSEFSNNGTLLCSTNYAPLRSDNGNLKPELMQSYRIYKQNWTGFPKIQPSIKITKQKLFLSWNGATELRKWQVEADTPRGFKDLGIFPISGFETAINLGTTSENFRITALGPRGIVLDSWEFGPEGVARLVRPESFSMSKTLRSFLWLLIWSCTAGLIWSTRSLPLFLRSRSKYKTFSGTGTFKN